MKLLIRNLAKTLTEVELRNKLEQFGIVQSCTIVLDAVTQQSKGFAIAHMPKVGEAKLAIKSLNGENLCGSVLRVKKYEEKTE